MEQDYMLFLSLGPGSIMVKMMQALNQYNFYFLDSMTIGNSQSVPAAQGTQVTAVHMGLVDTDMSQGMDAPKLSPAELANAGLDAIESGEQEVLADDWAKLVKSGLPLEPKQRYEQLFGATGA